MTTSRTYLDYDAGGFIVGINRMKDGIDNVHDDTQEIIQILKSQNQIANTRMSELSRAIRQNTHQSGRQSATQNNRVRQNNSGTPRISSASTNAQERINQTHRNRIPASRTSGNAGANRGSGPTDHPPSNVNRTRITSSSRRARITDSTSDDASTVSGANTRQRDGNTDTTSRTRDANGRFTSGSTSAIDRLASNISRNLSGIGTNTGGVDPVLDSLKEAKDLLSPIGRAGKLVGRGAKFSISKLKSLKRREPLPQDQDRHNRENEKLLDKIWKAIRKNSGGAGGNGLLGGLLGGTRGGNDRRRGGRGRTGRIRDLAGRGLRAVGGIKGLGAVAAIAGAGGLAMNWGELSKEEKTERVGATAGGSVGAIAGGVIGSLAGPIGTVAGATVGGWIGANGGEVLARSVTPHVSRWTDNLNRADLPKKMLNSFTSGLRPLFSGAGSIWDWVKDKVGGMIGFGGGDSSDSGYDGGEPSEVAMKASDYAIQKAANVSLGKCAEYVNNAFRSQGLQAQGDGKDVAGNLIALNKGKFEKVNYSADYVPKIGDVMSMNPTKGAAKKAGHSAIYTSQGWVSDFKQGDKYGNTGAPSKKYYDEITSGVNRPTIARPVNPNGGGQASGASAPASSGGKTKQAMDYFVSQGWTKAQAAGIVGNLQKESGFFMEDVISGKRKGDGGKAYGIAQWHPDRQQNFKKAFGKSITQSTFQDQLKFVNHELTNGTEQAAGKRLRKATSAAQAGAIVSQFYERPAAVEAEKRERAVLAEKTLKGYGGNSVLGAQGGKMKASSNLLPASQSYGATPTRLPAIPGITIPNAPKIVDRLDSGGNKPIILQASNDTINQNVSDRGLAHAITGGLGQDRHWG